MKSRNDPDVAVPSPAYGFSAHAVTFFTAAFGTTALAGVVFAGTASALIGRDPAWGDDGARYTNHMEANLARNVLRQTIVFGVGAALQ